MYKIGLDIGSTTIKVVLLDENNIIIDKSYNRHYSKIIENTISLLKGIKEKHQIDEAYLTITGSAAMGFSENLNLPFIQEVYATKISANTFLDKPDCIIELGGEDAKILFLSHGLEVRMNGSCAGGTGAFIDQMASLLNVSITDLNEMAKKATKTYTIASRCGVFAKSDIQPLLNQGANKNDVALSIFYAVVNQTISGLAQGRKIEGNVIYLGGPLTFLSELRNAFDNTLKIKGINPDNSLYYVALGAALSSDKIINLNDIINKLENYNQNVSYNYLMPLFNDENEYKNFLDRHNKAIIKSFDINKYEGDSYLGIDSGSTTIKLVLINEDDEILYQRYEPNRGNAIDIIKESLIYLYQNYPNIKIKSSCVTGYGEEFIRNAFNVDYGLVETIAHYKAAQKFIPDVDFIIDIGGQDIKCFHIRNKSIDNIFLNEACSSGCGSFLQTFAKALGYNSEEFSKLGLFSKAPVDLGSRCTVFMNSSVKQAQKDGATINDISAGLSISVVKNALYKVIRITNPDQLGKKIVVQGGTFYNDAVLRAFERELNLNVIRPNISGLMGAYGASLYAKNKFKENNNPSILLNLEELLNFKHKVVNTVCKLCNNYCKLTINTFSNKKSFINGNRCEKPITRKNADQSLNIYEFKRNLLQSYKPLEGKRGKIGIPLVLNMYELFPFWYKFFTSLNFDVITTDFSSRKTYLEGQYSIPSDTVCYPAKLVHGHIQELINKGIKNIFYPCMSYNIDEDKSSNHFNCPVVAYYPEVINANMDLKNINFIYDFVGLHSKVFPKKIFEILRKYFKDITYNEVKKASKEAFKEYQNYFNQIDIKSKEIYNESIKQNKEIICLAGRPYHLDPGINHGIDKLIIKLGASVLSEDFFSRLNPNNVETTVVNQWTYHARLYQAADYIKDKNNINLIQLVSFGCGLDAITTDQVKDILESNNKIYTQLKIDEITNLGAVTIRLRSLFSALELKD